MDIPISRGLASQLAGVGPCGHDPEADPSAVVTQAPVAALYFDPYDRVYSQNADLSMVAGAGPIHRAAHLLLPLGALSSTPRSGLDVQSIKRALPSRRQRAVEDALRVAWKGLIAEGQITMGAVTLEPVEPGKAWSGKFYVEVTDAVTQRSLTLTGNT